MHSLETRNLLCTEHNSSRILLQSFICPTIEGTPSVAPSSRELIPKNVVAARQSLPDWWPRWRPPVDWYHCRGREFLGRFYAAARVHHPTSNLNTESARLSRRRREKEKRRGSEKARERPERGSKKVGQKNGGEEKRREREAEGCTGFVGYVGPGNSGTEPSSSPSLSGILIIRAGSLRGEQPGQGCSAAGLLFASCPVLRGYRPPTACSSRVPFSLSLPLSLRPPHYTASPPLLSRRIHSRARSPVASRVLMSFVEHLSPKEAWKNCYQSFSNLFFSSRENRHVFSRRKSIDFRVKKGRRRENKMLEMSMLFKVKENVMSVATILYVTHLSKESTMAFPFSRNVFSMVSLRCDDCFILEESKFRLLSENSWCNAIFERKYASFIFIPQGFIHIFVFRRSRAFSNRICSRLDSDLRFFWTEMQRFRVSSDQRESRLR